MASDEFKQQLMHATIALRIEVRSACFNYLHSKQLCPKCELFLLDVWLNKRKYIEMPSGKLIQPMPECAGINPELDSRGFVKQKEEYTE